MTESMQRNPFFLPSGFEPQEIINIIEAKGEMKKRLDKIKGRKKQEGSHIRRFRYNSKVCNISNKRHKKIISAEINSSYILGIRNKRKPSKKSTKNDQIQYGFDLAKWWGLQHG